MKILHEQLNEGKGTFRLEDNGQQAGIMTYSIARNILIISHTEVDPKYEGQGLGKKLVMAGVEYARKNNLKIKPLCPFANKVFDRTPEIADVLF